MRLQMVLGAVVRHKVRSYRSTFPFGGVDLRLKPHHLIKTIGCFLECLIKIESQPQPRQQFTLPLLSVKLLYFITDNSKKMTSMGSNSGDFNDNKSTVSEGDVKPSIALHLIRHAESGNNEVYRNARYIYR